MTSEVEIIARVAAVDPRGRILLTRREGRDYWVLPGGHVGPGERLPAAAAREAAEETGVPVEVGPFLCAWEVFHLHRRMLQCAFLGRISGDAVPTQVEDRGPTGGVRYPRLVPLEEVGSHRVFPAALAAPGIQTMIRQSLRMWGSERDPYLGVEGAAHLTLPHRLNTRMILVHDEGLLLVSDDSEAYWFLPGGHVDSEETLDSALIRETAEETGVLAAPERMLYLREFVDNNLDEHAIECYFLGRAQRGDVRIGVEPDFRDVSTVHGEVTRARWFARADLRHVVVYPEALRDRLWDDLARPLPDRYLGIVRLD